MSYGSTYSRKSCTFYVGNNPIFEKICRQLYRLLKKSQKNAYPNNTIVIREPEGLIFCMIREFNEHLYMPKIFSHAYKNICAFIGDDFLPIDDCYEIFRYFIRGKQDDYKNVASDILSMFDENFELIERHKNAIGKQDFSKLSHIKQMVLMLCPSNSIMLANNQQKSTFINYSFVPVDKISKEHTTDLSKTTNINVQKYITNFSKHLDNYRNLLGRTNSHKKCILSGVKTFIDQNVVLYGFQNYFSQFMHVFAQDVLNLKTESVLQYYTNIWSKVFKGLKKVAGVFRKILPCEQAIIVENILKDILESWKNFWFHDQNFVLFIRRLLDDRVKNFNLTDQISLEIIESYETLKIYKRKHDGQNSLLAIHDFFSWHLNAYPTIWNSISIKQEVSPRKRKTSNQDQDNVKLCKL